MTVIKGSTIRDRIYSNGSHGNASIAIGACTLVSGQATTDDVVELLELCEGLKIYAVSISSTSGLGTGEFTVNIGELDIDAGTIGAGEVSFTPLAIYEASKGEKLTITANNAACIGDVTIAIHYVSTGNA